MSTRSLICQKLCDQYKTIYCHYDGYPQHMLEVLDKHYREDELLEVLDKHYKQDELREIENLKRIDKLLETRLTAINEDGSLEPGLHLGDNIEDKPQLFNKAQLLDYAEGTNAEYIYIYHDQSWHVISVDNPLLEQEATQ